MRKTWKYLVPYSVPVAITLLGSLATDNPNYWADVVANLFTVFTWWYITIGLLLFYFWQKRYRAIKSLERKGLLYLAILREAFPPSD